MTRLNAGDIIVARYEVTESVSSPLSDAENWHAQDKIFSREVDVLVIDETVPEGALDRARATAQINSDSIARVVDVIDKGPSQRFVVSELSKGVGTAAAISQSTLTVPQAKAVMGRVATALVKASEKGIHHGGLTADSILFGEQSVTVTGLVPRNVLGLNLDESDEALARRDARGLSALMYFMLTGLMSNYASEENSFLPSLVEIVDDVTPDLDALTTEVLNGENASIDSPAAFLKALGEWSVDDLPSTSPLLNALAVEDDQPSAIPPVPVPPQRTSARSTVSPSNTPPSFQPSANPVSVGAPAVGVGVGAGVGAGVPTVGGAAANFGNGSLGQLPTMGSQTQVGLDSQGIAAAASAPSGTPPRFVPSSSEVPRPSFDHVPSPPSAGGGGPQNLTGSGGSSRRFDPTAVIMVFFAALVVFGLFWAINTLTAPTEPAIVAPTGRPTPEATAGEGTKEPSKDPTITNVKPEIASARSLDPQGDNNEHPELQDRLIDGDTTSVWYSRTYKAADFAGFTRNGIGIEVKLKEKSAVNSVLISSGNTGGQLEIRATDGDDPTKGAVLAKGPLNGDTLFKFDSPVETKFITIWWTELPKDSEGKNRAYVYEVGIG